MGPIAEISACEKAQRYVTSVLRRIPSFESEVVSVIIFGSYAKDDLSESSDVDLLVILKDSTPEEKVIELTNMVKALEMEYGFAWTGRSFVEGILRALSLQTGMFASHFVCRESSFIQLDFARIFHTDRFLTGLIAPKRIVLGGVLCHARTLYGKDLLSQITPPNASFLDILGSLVMNLLLAMGAVFVTPFDPAKGVRFSIQAVKWSVFSAYYFLYGKSPSLTQLGSNFLRESIIYPQITMMIDLRKHPTVSKKFTFIAPVAVTLIHLLSMKAKSGRI